jgi:transcriptional regulator with XRE-family HTH domain
VKNEMHIKHPNNLRYYRVKQKYTQQDVLKVLGHSSASRLSAWENGEAIPSIKHLIALSELYRVPVDKLVGGFAKKAKKSAVKEPVPIEKEDSSHGSEFIRHFGKEYEEMSTEELLDVFAEIVVDSE